MPGTGNLQGATEFIVHKPAIRSYVVKSLGRYWPKSQEAVYRLPIPRQVLPENDSILPLISYVGLPKWAAHFGINGEIPVPEWLVIKETQPAWRGTDWFMVIHWYLNSLAEREYEREYGSIHSYSIRLKGWNKDLWQRAWVNRIALFLRSWAARENNIDETELLGPLPETEIILTHDVDAVRKTMAIRCKQTAFHFFNAALFFFRGKISKSANKIWKGIRFLTSQDDYWCFENIMDQERQAGVRSHLNFFGGGHGGSSWREKLFDPSYDVLEPKIKAMIEKLEAGGWTVGLHPSYLAWKDVSKIKAERQYLEKAAGKRVSNCRQHWLRFSWQDTWKAQQEAGIRLDTTLGFNDRPGFRNGAALRFQPWDGAPMRLEALPMVLMDSHLYDYFDLDEECREQEMHRWINEIRAVRGQASVIWHTHVLAADYGWRTGFEHLLTALGSSSK